MFRRYLLGASHTLGASVILQAGMTSGHSPAPLQAMASHQRAFPMMKRGVIKSNKTQ